MDTAEYDAVRIGRGLYMDAQDAPVGGIREVASWRAAIVGIRDYPAGTRLGYGQGVILEKDTRVAMVNVGYGDGLNHRVAAGGPALVDGQTAHFLGCCMDQSFLDVGDIPCQVGSEVTLFGYDREGNFLSSQEVSLLIGDNEGCGLISDLSPRVERICE
jgi:alanine racemase